MILPNNILKCMKPEDRAPLGKAGMTTEEAGAAFVAKRESELQSQIEQMLSREGIYVVRQRTDRKSTVRIGTPDLLFAVNGQAVAWEVKMPKQHPRPEQVAAMEHMARNGWRVAVIHSYDEARLELQILRAQTRDSTNGGGEYANVE